ncbi:MAG: response regulator [Bacteroidia bacterium]|nr:response regulator [Bacteroidia bacterium]
MNSEGTHTDKPVTVMIIDDDAVTIFLTKKSLQNFDPTLTLSHFISGREAFASLSKAGAEQPMIILLDINMPLYNGWDFLKDYSNTSCNSSIFMFTSSIDPNDLIKSKTFSNVKGFISKPLDQNKIQDILDTL